MIYFEDFPHGASGKEHSYQSRLDIRHVASITGSGRSPRGGHGDPLQYFWSEESKYIKEPGELQSIALQRAGHDGSHLASTQSILS